MNWVYLWPGGCLLCLPWCWLTVNVFARGGICLDIDEPPNNGPGEPLGAFLFDPTCIVLWRWKCPKNPVEWQRQMSRWWMDLREAGK